ncbi:hypothetical protein ACIF6L_38100 [Kitasatospora sp. NPDC086009]|uniref:hypothetical protein n=1 Tax=unclassified Kitasatospora TaxID=2633591 RepID=UPI0037CA9A45
MYRSLARGTRATASCTAASTAVGEWAPATLPAATTTAVACPLGTEAVTFTPRLKLAVPPPAPLDPSVSLSASGALAACVSLDLHHTSGTIMFTGSGPLTCLGGNPPEARAGHAV